MIRHLRPRGQSYDSVVRDSSSWTHHARLLVRHEGRPCDRDGLARHRTLLEGFYENSTECVPVPVITVEHMAMWIFKRQRYCQAKSFTRALVDTIYIGAMLMASFY
ncbi:hypothetical protein RSAG8_04795, partial [Rhizoctonia solani AG-8 WAC10335]